MELIADEIKLRQDALTYQVVDKLKDILKETNSYLFRYTDKILKEVKYLLRRPMRPRNRFDCRLPMLPRHTLYRTYTWPKS